MGRKVIVVPHDPRWAEEFARESVVVRDALGDNATAIHHIGSTSIPGIYAKPIIDFLVEVADLKEVDSCSASMRLAGYEGLGEFGIPGRRYFRKDNASGVRTHQIHAFRAGTADVIRHVAFRDFLWAHPDHARRYSDLKRQLAERFPEDMESYMDGKDAMIQELQREAVEWHNAAIRAHGAQDML